MTPEAQRIAIAEACGYKGVGENEADMCGIPDYLSDLNAMREAEALLNFDQQKRFIEWLVERTMHDEYCTEMLWDSAWIASHARASNRAEAFLRALNKWTDTNEADQPQQ